MQNKGSMIKFELPIKTVSEANCSEHWVKKSKRHKNQQFFVRIGFLKFVKDIKFPCLIRMVRLGPRILDSDNLQSAFKYIRDEISECLLPELRKTYINKHGNEIAIKGRADSDERIIWQYAQEKQAKQGVRIEIDYENE